MNIGQIFMALILLIIFLPFIYMTVRFQRNLAVTLTFQVRKSCSFLLRNKKGGDPTSAGRRLPSMSRPAIFFDRAHGRIPEYEVPPGEIDNIIRNFEQNLIQAENRLYTFYHLKNSGESKTSILIEFKAGAFHRFYAWLELQKFASLWEWKLNFSEIRGWRSYEEDQSHFEFSRHYFDRYQDDGNGIGSLNFTWDFLTGNVPSHKNGKKAAAFERRIKEAFAQALHTATGSIFAENPRTKPASVTSASGLKEAQSSQRVRPPRRTI
jgi:hypothetical protein